MTGLIESQTCTCPSGDGSLRWPYPVHPPQENVMIAIAYMVYLI